MPRLYLPFAPHGRYTVIAGLRALAPEPHFQVDEQYREFVDAKWDAGERHPDRYELRQDLAPDLHRAAARFACETLPVDSPQTFAWDGTTFTNHALGLTLVPDFEALTVAAASDPRWVGLPLLTAFTRQTQEDWALVTRDPETGLDRAAAIHVSFPSNWRPGDKIGKSFVAVHQPVAGIDPLLKAAPSILTTMIEKGPWERFTWTLARDYHLDEHLDAVAERPVPPVPDPEAVGDTVWLRVERQVVQGFPAARGALFLIRLHLVRLRDVAEAPGAAAALAAAVRSMTPASLDYKGLASWHAPVLTYLDSRA